MAGAVPAGSTDVAGDDRLDPVGLERLALASLVAGHLLMAGAAAVELLKRASEFDGHWNQGNLLHRAHVLLGHRAALDGDIAAAAEHLQHAGAVPASPQLNDFGPDMSLARVVLRAGRRDDVLAYFEACRSLWTEPGAAALDEWTATVTAGDEPDFGANLVIALT